jgi:iron complex outermembrane recepter protein
MSTVNGSGISAQPSLAKLAVRVFIVAPLSLCYLSGAALAQSGNSSSDPADSNQPAGQKAALEEVIVTAEKRSSNLQRTPISVTAFNSEALQSEQVHSLPDLKMLVPAMQMGETDGYAQITIRGIGISNFTSGQESAVAFNMNEVYVSRPIAQLGGLFDVSSLEVLRGPQGTLYGRNATAGSINISTTRPTDNWSGYVSVTAGNYAAVRTEGAIGGPIVSDLLEFRVAGFEDKHDGYGKNVVTGNPVSDKDARGARGTLLFIPTSTVKVTLIGDYFEEHDNGAALHFFGSTGLTGLPGALAVPSRFITQGGFTTYDLQDTASPIDSKFNLRTSSVTGIVEWSDGPFAVKSITGYRDQSSLTLSTIDPGSTGNSFYYAGEPAHQLSEELQAHYDTTRLHVTGGLYYFQETDQTAPDQAVVKKSEIDSFFGIPFVAPDYFVDFVDIGGTTRTKAKAVFAQGTYEILDNLSVTAGIRYSSERKEATLNDAFSLDTPWSANMPPPAPLVEAPKTFNSTTPKVGIQEQLTPDCLVYFSYSKGFKAGGFDTSAPSPAYKPETLTDYEGGIKTTFLQDRLRLNLSGFYYDYTNLQVIQVIGVSAVTSNAGSAHVYGAEAEITARPVPQLTLDFAGSYLHARYLQYVGPSSVQPLVAEVDFSGHALDNAPDFSGHAGATYAWPVPHGSVSLRAETEFTTRVYFTPDNINMVSQGGFVKGNAFLTYERENGWRATAFVRNISNRDTRVSGLVSIPEEGAPAHGSVAPPRTFGAEVMYKF